MKVYILTTGEYSSYRIEKVFTNRKKAEQAVAAYNDTHDYDEYVLEEYDSSDDEIESNKTPHKVYGALIYPNRKHPHVNRIPSYTFRDKSWVNEYSYNIIADTYAEAIRIAEDYFAKNKAEKEGIC